MDKNTLSQYGWATIVIIILIILISLATPFGNFISSAVLSSTTAFKTLTDAKIELVKPATIDTPITNISTILHEEGLVFKSTPSVTLAGPTVTDCYLIAPANNTSSFDDCIPNSGSITFTSDYDSIHTGITVKVDNAEENVGLCYLVIIGDVNGDGVVDISDAGDIEYYIVYGEFIHNSPHDELCEAIDNGSVYLAADVNNDGQITMEDVDLVVLMDQWEISYSEIYSTYYDTEEMRPIG